MIGVKFISLLSKLPFHSPLAFSLLMTLFSLYPSPPMRSQFMLVSFCGGVSTSPFVGFLYFAFYGGFIFWILQGLFTLPFEDKNSPPFPCIEDCLPLVQMTATSKTDQLSSEFIQSTLYSLNPKFLTRPLEQNYI